MQPILDAAVRRFNRGVLRNLGLTLRRYRHDQAFLNDKRAMRLLYFARRFRQIEEIDGDVVECGVSFGISLLTFAYLAKCEERKRTLWGFDTFEGLPEPSSVDQIDRNVRGKHAVGVGTVRAMLEASGIGEEFVRERIRLVPGLVEDTLPGYAGDRIALLHIDLDLYEGYRVTLSQLYDKVAPGGLVLFDEYLDELSVDKWPGPKRAIREFFGDDVDRIQHDPIADKYYWVKP